MLSDTRRWRPSPTGRGCVKTHDDDFDRTKYDGKVDCRSILCKCYDQESPESKTENEFFVFLHTLGREDSFDVTTGATGSWRPKAELQHIRMIARKQPFAGCSKLLWS